MAVKARADFELAQERAAVEQLRAQLGAVTDEDWILTIESESNLLEAADAVLEQIDEAEMMATAVKARAAVLTLRAKKFEDKAETLRGLLVRAMEAAGVKTLPLATATLSLKSVAPGLVITDETKIPMNFFERQAPKLNREALKKALEAKQSIEGAALGNGSQTLQVRRK